MAFKNSPQLNILEVMERVKTKEILVISSQNTIRDWKVIIQRNC